MPFINGIGAPELIIILIIALIVVGPGRLPDVGSALGKSIREFRKAATDVKDATSLEPAAGTATPTAPQPTSAQPAPPPLPAATTAAPPAGEPATPATATTTAPYPVGAPPAPAAEPSQAVADAAAAVPAPDISQMPEPVPAADEQRTPTA